MCLGMKFKKQGFAIGKFDFTVQKQPPEVFCIKGVLRKIKNFTGKHLCTGVFCEFCEIYKNNFFTEYLRTTASDSYQSEVAAQCFLPNHET